MLDMIPTTFANMPPYFVLSAVVFIVLGTGVSEAANFAGKLTSDELQMLKSGRLRKSIGRGQP